MKTTAEVRVQKDKEGKEKLQFLAARLDNWDVTNLVDESKIVNVKALKEKAKTSKNSVFVEVDLSDKVVERTINTLRGYAKHNYVQAVYGIPESFRFP